MFYIDKKKSLTFAFYNNNKYPTNCNKNVQKKKEHH